VRWADLRLVQLKFAITNSTMTIENGSSTMTIETAITNSTFFNEQIQALS
jgi:hypothetical protein